MFSYQSPTGPEDEGINKTTIFPLIYHDLKKLGGTPHIFAYAPTLKDTYMLTVNLQFTLNMKTHIDKNKRVEIYIRCYQ